MKKKYLKEVRQRLLSEKPGKPDILTETSRSISPELKEALEQTILPNFANNSKK